MSLNPHICDWLKSLGSFYFMPKSNFLLSLFLSFLALVRNSHFLLYPIFLSKSVAFLQVLSLSLKTPAEMQSVSSLIQETPSTRNPWDSDFSIPAAGAATCLNFLCVFSYSSHAAAFAWPPYFLLFSPFPTLHFPLLCYSTFACTRTPSTHLHACLPLLCIPPGPYISLTQFAVPFLNAFSLPAAPTISGMSIFSCPLPGPHRVANEPLASLMASCLLPDCK